MDTPINSSIQPASHKPRKYCPIKKKLHVIEMAENIGVNKAARLTGIHNSCISRWMSNKSHLLRQHSSRKTLHRGRKSILSSHTERRLVNELLTLRSNGIPVTGPLIKTMAIRAAQTAGVSTFNASNGWLDRFSKRHALSYRKCTKKISYVSDDMFTRLVEMQSYIFHYCETNDIDYIINFDETPINYDMVLQRSWDQRGSSEILLNTRDSKNRITVALGIIYPLKTHLPQLYKCKPLLIFKGKTPRCVNTIDRRDQRTVVSWNENAWMTAQQYCRVISETIPQEIRQFKILIIHDGFSGHLRQDVVDVMNNLGYHSYVLPANSTALCQPLDVVVNKPFKDRMRQLYHQWMLANPQRKVQKHELHEWVAIVWTEFPSVMIQHAFRCCGIAVDPNDGETSVYWKSLNSLRQTIERDPVTSRMSDSVFEN